MVFKGYQVRVGVLGNNEVDFVAEKEGEKKHIQVALTINDPATLECEFGNLKKISDNYPKMVITMDSFSGNTHEGIQTMDLRNFLLS
ncbi:hypothetical protein U3A58_21580 [Algoriphagus sp. C2-6-M1]|uniref:hypothetical protein n=1 Tax=Algoriphagus persicinus TaxID=3108754 RepID=UPI002B38012F|nr:hypothetical protein [Algoriphagus sp. C2-6-M1]MEB2782980.1 hypothetical protein [Algoriphagus sp. C2-6-M1]